MTGTEIRACDQESAGPIQLFWRLVARLNKDESSTFHRFAISKHVADLRWIVMFCLSLAWAAIAVVVSATWGTAASLGSVGAILGVFGAVVAWSYQTAGARLGVVDLFACEIGTLCRVGAVVDVADGMIKEAEADPDRSGPNGFTSEEEYFPVFSSNSRDLQILEAEVVVNITAFYTYMKAMRDTLRKLAALPPQTPAANANPRHDVMRNAIYMLFLAFESGRKAIGDLIEFEPLRAECQVAILLTEVQAFLFLLKTASPKDFRSERLMLRLPEYAQLVDEVCSQVETEAQKEPDPATLPKASRLQEKKRHQAWVMAKSPAQELRARWAGIEITAQPA